MKLPYFVIVSLWHRIHNLHSSSSVIVEYWFNVLFLSKCLNRFTQKIIFKLGLQLTITSIIHWFINLFSWFINETGVGGEEWMSIAIFQNRLLFRIVIPENAET